MPHLYVICGCNGAGKTTASYSILPDLLHCKEFINSDEIAKGISPFNSGSAAIEAGRVMLRRIDELITKKANFAIETTLSVRSYVRWLTRAKQEGYLITLVFFWLNSPELAVARVRMRVESGGHDIPQKVIYRRYYAGIKNFFLLYLPICDFWMIIDNSVLPSQLIAEGLGNNKTNVIDHTIFNKLKTYE